MALIEATFVLSAEELAGDALPCACLTPAAADRLGVAEITLLVIRPDGHLGLRADREHVQALAAYHLRLQSA
jgi:hypothetical protein